jgi:hypothetical protein
MAERKQGADESTWKGLKDIWYPPNTAKPYRVLTCVSKSVEAALMLAGVVEAGVSVMTKTPPNPDLHLVLGGIVGVAVGAGTLTANAKLDEHTVRRNTKRE